MIGAINNINKKEITGWAANDFNSKPVKVHLYINGKKIKQKLAKEHRAYLLEKKIHATGNCGFTFKVGKIDFKPLKDNIEIKCLANIKPTQVLVNKIFAQKRKYMLNTKQLFFFVHIPKTAGTSFRNMLYKQFDQKNIFPNKFDIANNDNRYPKINDVKQIIPKRFKNLNLFSGHYTIAAGKEVLGSDFKPIVIFRDPIKRTISLLYQLQRINPIYKGKTLEEVFDNEPNQVTNVQCYYLTGEVPPIKQDERHLKKAIQCLENLEVFGIVEQFDKSVELISAKYNWKLGSEKKLNKNPRSQKVINDHLMKKIIKSNQLDMKLYEAALNLFNKFV